jgi:hypothetical protein
MKVCWDSDIDYNLRVKIGKILDNDGNVHPNSRK